MSNKESGVSGSLYPIAQPALDYLPSLDIRTVARLSRTMVSTLAMQLGRGIYPWVEIGQQGRSRFFDPATALHISITGILADFGIAAGQGSAIALNILRIADLAQPDLQAVIGLRPEPAPGEILSPHPHPVWVGRATELEKVLGDQQPVAKITIDLSALVRLVEAAAKRAGEVEPDADEAEKA